MWICLLYTSFSLSSSPKQIISDLEEMISAKAADGIIINSSFITPKLERLILQYDFPQICIGEPAFDSILSWIDTNNSLSANLAVEHLLQCGCRRLAFMGGQESDKIFMDRLKGFKEVYKRQGELLLRVGAPRGRQGEIRHPAKGQGAALSRRPLHKARALSLIHI